MKTPEQILDEELSKLPQNSGFIKIFYTVNRGKILKIIKSIQDDTTDICSANNQKNKFLRTIKRIF